MLVEILNVMLRIYMEHEPSGQCSRYKCIEPCNLYQTMNCILYCITLQYVCTDYCTMVYCITLQELLIVIVSAIFLLRNRALMKCSSKMLS